MAVYSVVVYASLRIFYEKVTVIIAIWDLTFGLRNKILIIHIIFKIRRTMYTSQNPKLTPYIAQDSTFSINFSDKSVNYCHTL